ncbi:hypothetical protein ACQBAT_12785 [Ornithinimicrobium sp. Y1847]|uniref:hypothetical protein n=1 Tax=unclassified Ornithinimicrobium TaxID=2615080 RepID=UPI003B6811DB
MKTAAFSRTRRPARAALVGGVAAATLALSGCMVNSPQTTMLRYNPGDGVELDGTAIDARDVLVVSHGEGGPGVVSGTLINSGTEPVTVTVAVGGEDAGEVTVEPGSIYRLDGVSADGSQGERTTVSAVDTAPGEQVEVRFQANGETLSASVPVLLPHGHYEGFADDAGGTVAPHPAQEEGDH